MTYAARTLIASLVLLSFHGSATAHGGLVLGAADRPVRPTPTVESGTLVVAPAAVVATGTDQVAAEHGEDPAEQPITGLVAFGATPVRQERLDWAAARFAAAGLDLPYVEVHFFDSREPCDGYEGTFRHHDSPLRIDVCNSNKMIIIHELAHAWEKVNVSDATREAFMDLRGLDAWNVNVADRGDLGVEEMAEVIVWGLLEHAGSFGAEAASDLAAFELVTGVQPPRNPVVTHRLPVAEPSASDYS